MIGDTLDNLKILDITAGFAGAYASRLLTDLGATVDRPIGSVSYTHLTLPTSDLV